MSPSIAVIIVLTTVLSAAGQQSTRPDVELECSANKASYTSLESVDVTISFHNQGSSDVYVYKVIEWGWTGLRFRLLDSSGHVVALRKPPPLPPPPPPLRDKSQLLELREGYFYGAHLLFDLALYDVKPGAYSIQTSYRSYYRAADGFGLPILTWDDGEFVSNKVEIQIRPN